MSVPGSIGDALATATARLANGGIEDPRPDARRLLAAALAADGGGDDPLRLIRERDLPLQPAIARAFDAMLARRLTHEPVARILGIRWFYGRPFHVTPATLDPRPDSETLVDLCLSLLRDHSRPAPRLLDIGTGSGCLLLTLLAEVPAATGVGTDIDPAALTAAAGNAAALGVSRRCDWRLGADFTPLTPDDHASFDLILSNPPYIPTAEIQALDPDVREFDPRTALDGGADGLDVYRRLCAQLAPVAPASWVAFEVGAGQADAVSNLFTGAWQGQAIELRTARDLGGHVRCVAARPRPVGVR